MAVRTKEYLKDLFAQNQKLTPRKWEDLIDSIFDASGGVVGSGVDINKIENTIFVNEFNTTSESGDIGYIHKPYADLDAALTASSTLTNPTIVIFPGTYQCNNLYRGGLKIYAFPGVTISCSNTTYPLFEGAGTGVCELLGEAKLVTNGNGIAALNTTDEKLRIQCAEIDVTIDGTAFLVQSGAKLQVEGASITSSGKKSVDVSATFEVDGSSVCRLKNVEMVSTQTGDEKDGIGGFGKYECFGGVYSNMPMTSTATVSFGQYSYYQNFAPLF